LKPGLDSIRIEEIALRLFDVETNALKGLPDIDRVVVNGFLNHDVQPVDRLLELLGDFGVALEDPPKLRVTRGSHVHGALQWRNI
jgi:hypothetical protein